MTLKKFNSVSFWLVAPLAILGIGLSVWIKNDLSNRRIYGTAWMAIVLTTGILLLIMKLGILRREQTND